MNFLNVVTRVIEATASHTSTIIFLHGLGGDLRVILEFAERASKELPGARFVFPQAPAIPLTLLHGHRGSAWFDIRELDLKAAAESTVSEDLEGIRAASEYVEQLVASEASMLGEQGKVYLGGHSQGAALALHSAIRMAALRPDLPLGGLFLFNGYLAGIKTLVADYMPREEVRLPPIHYAYGEQDTMIPPCYQITGIYVLRQLFPVRELVLHGYAGAGHNVVQPMIADAVRHLKPESGHPVDVSGGMALGVPCPHA